MDPSNFAAISSSSFPSPTVIRQNYPALTLDASLFMDTSLDTSSSLSTPTRKQSIYDNPLDTRYAAAAPTSSNSSTGGGILTEFTKRKNWSQRIIDELKDFLHVLSPTGKILYCTPSSLELVGYAPEELVGRIFTDFIHVDDIDMFVREFQMAIHTRRDFKLYYRFRKKDDKFIVFEVTGHPYFSEGSAVAKCFFAMAQPYPTKATSMLDSFLELKIENERLRHRLRDLRASRNEKSQPSADTDPASAALSSSPSSSLSLPPLPPHATLPLLSPPPTADDTEIFDAPLTYSSHRHSNDAIEKLTGMRYLEGERSTGISTGSTDATLESDPVEIVGPAASVAAAAAAAAAVSTSEEKKPPRKKKPKTEDDEYVCTDCGTTESPEWRKGPSGPKTLCNACGLRWAKKNKKTGGEGEGDGE